MANSEAEGLGYAKTDSFCQSQDSTGKHGIRAKTINDLQKFLRPRRWQKFFQSFRRGYLRQNWPKKFRGTTWGERLPTGQLTRLRKLAQSSSRKERAFTWWSNNLET